jgi:hypothetical protein
MKLTEKLNKLTENKKTEIAMESVNAVNLEKTLDGLSMSIRAIADAAQHAELIGEDRISDLLNEEYEKIIKHLNRFKVVVK